jgi:hypothetical protein
MRQVDEMMPNTSTVVPPNHCMQPTLQPVIKFACANLSPVWRAADAGCWAGSSR